MKALSAVLLLVLTFSSPLRAEPLELTHPSETPIALSFVEENGNAIDFTAFEGQYVVVNFWATWCAPCVAEMPSLDRLEAALADEDVKVVAISIDRGPTGKLRTFYDDLGLEHLDIYHDVEGQARRQLRIAGLPMTMVLDRENREIARHLGPNEWDSPEIVAFLKNLNNS